MESSRMPLTQLPVMVTFYITTEYWLKLRSQPCSSAIRTLLDFPRFSKKVLFLFWDPIQDPTLHLTALSLPVGDSFLVFYDSDTFEEDWSVIL